MVSLLRPGFLTVVPRGTEHEQSGQKRILGQIQRGPLLWRRGVTGVALAGGWLPEVEVQILPSPLVVRESQERGVPCNHHNAHIIWCPQMAGAAMLITPLLWRRGGIAAEYEIKSEVLLTPSQVQIPAVANPSASCWGADGNARYAL